MKKSIEFLCDCMNYGTNGITGHLSIYDDKIIFRPTRLMKMLIFWNKWEDLVIDLNDVKGVNKKKMGNFDVVVNDLVITFRTFQVDVIVDAIERRRNVL